MRPDRLKARRIERILRAAQDAPYYQERRATWTGTQAIRNPEAALSQAPLLQLREFLDDPAAFQWPESAGQRPLRLPFADAGRVAVLGGGFAQSTQVRVFRYDSADDLREFRPDTLAGPVSRLRKIALDVVAGRLELPQLETGVVVFTGLRHGFLDGAERELLWKAFRVPVFEQFQGFSRETLASECEAHEGLHIDVNSAVFELAPPDQLLLTCLNCTGYALLRLAIGFAAKLDAPACACGLASPRLLGLRPLH